MKGYFPGGLTSTPPTIFGATGTIPALSLADEEEEDLSAPSTRLVLVRRTREDTMGNFMLRFPNVCGMLLKCGIWFVIFDFMRSIHFDFVTVLGS